MEEKGEEEVVGMLVGKNQTGPNYRNHNESVSRGTLLPGKHHKKQLRAATNAYLKRALTQMLRRKQKCTGATFLRTQYTHFCFTVFTKKYTLVHIGAHACVSICTQTHTQSSPNLVWILIISLARPV